MSNQPITAFPLYWPASWPRTDFCRIKHSRYGDHSLAGARRAIADQVRLLGGKNLVVSSNVELRNDGLPRSGQRQPADRGAAVYFDYKAKPVCFACDSWSAVEDNFWAINLTIEAIRQIERAGASELLERAFSGFAALPAPAGENWWEVLGVSKDADEETVRTVYRELVKIHHPDAGGNAEQFHRVQTAYEAYQRG
jgi:hypothetical protein